MIDTHAVDEAVHELDAMVRADGARLALVAADPATARVEVALDLSQVDCLECVLPPQFLEQMLTHALAQRCPRRLRAGAAGSPAGLLSAPGPPARRSG